MISRFDHVFSSVGDNDLETTLARFERAGFLIGPQRVRHARGWMSAAALMTGSYLEFLKVVDEAVFQRDASLEERFYRDFPQPYGMGARTHDALALARALQAQFPETPAPQQAEAARAVSEFVWTFCSFPPRALPGTFVFALQCHQSGQGQPTLRQGPNTIFALGGFVFCSPHAVRLRAAWHSTLRSITQVELKSRVLKFGAQELEWISPETYCRRTGQAFTAGEPMFGTIAAVKLLCSDVAEACRRLSAENFRCVRQTKSKALFAPEPDTGYAFELIARRPDEFMARLM